MKKTIAFTSAAFNYVPKVRTLCNSMRKHHPEFEIVLALADKVPAGTSWESEPIDRVLPVGDLEIPDLERWTFFHAIVELATAIKPFALLKLLEDPSVERVIYFDPDMMLFSRLDDLLDDVQGASIGLTPHQTKPETTRRRVMDNEISSLKHGVYNLGFLVVNNNAEGRRFARWWADRIYDFCVADIPNGLFTDQRWVDLAPAFFDDVKILKSPRFNVAPWNVSTRELAGDTENGFTVDGEPLGFYHFTGFDSGAHAIMAEVNAPGNDSLRQLIEFYRHETRLDRNDIISNTPWAFGTYDNGLKIDTLHRRIYRSRDDLREVFPSPFSTEGESTY
ncbi:MAG TPA: glycosyltransferase, partial [Nitrospira sp.]|nr:glycosyltransferase [Nitrospira sp.]